MAIIADIADAVVSALNTPPTPFSQTFTAQRQSLPILELETMDSTLYVNVLTSAIPAISQVSRDASRRDYRIEVVIQKRLADETPASIDPLLTLAEEIIDTFQSQRLKDYKSAICVEVGNEPVYLADHLERLRQFTSVVSLTFRRKSVIT